MGRVAPPKGGVEARKVQRLGQTSLIVTLPKKWVNEVGLKPGDILFISVDEDKSLKIMPKGLEEKAEAPIYKIKTDICDRPRLLERVLTACYLSGHDKVILTTDKDKISPQHTNEVRSVISRLMGLSILDQKPDAITLHSFIDPTSFPIEGLVKRIYNLLSSMIEFMVRALETNDKSLLEEIVHMESEADKFYWLSVRQLFLVQRDRRVAPMVKIENPLHVLGYRIIVKTLEEACDAIYSIANLLLKYWDKKEIRNTVLNHKELLLKIPEISSQSLDALTNLDIKLANDIIEKVRSEYKAEAKLEELAAMGSLSSVDLFVLSRIFSVMEGFNIIGEITINRALETPSEILVPTS